MNLKNMLCVDLFSNTFKTLVSNYYYVFMVFLLNTAFFVSLLTLGMFTSFFNDTPAVVLVSFIVLISELLIYVFFKKLILSYFYVINDSEHKTISFWKFVLGYLLFYVVFAVMSLLVALIIRAVVVYEQVPNVIRIVAFIFIVVFFIKLNIFSYLYLSKNKLRKSIIGMKSIFVKNLKELFVLFVFNLIVVVSTLFGFYFLLYVYSSSLTVLPSSEFLLFLKIVFGIIFYLLYGSILVVNYQYLYLVVNNK